MLFRLGQFRLGGLTVAIISFGITRLVVTEALHLNSGFAYLFSGLLPLVVGLGITVYGIALVVGPYSESYSLVIAKWCVIGTMTMSLVVLLSSIEPLLAGAGSGVAVGSSLLLANSLLAGVVGGVAIGHRTATNHAQREANRRQANRALLLDRLLRHEVINAITIIRLNAESAPDINVETVRDTIVDATDRISDTIDKVAEFIEEKPSANRIDVARLVADELDEVRSEYPDVQFQYRGPQSGLLAVVDHRLERVVREFVNFLIRELGADEIAMRLENADYRVRVTIEHDGEDLRDDLRRLLTSGDFPRYDDPSSGFSLPIIRLLVREYGGSISVADDVSDGSRKIFIDLPKSDRSHTDKGLIISNSQIVAAGLTGILAGGVMGGYLVATTDLIPIIGALYGAPDPVVGWSTHLFHSVVFAIIFAAIVSHPRIRKFASEPLRGLLAGVAWGVVLWLLAAGLVMPLWLNLVGIPAELPNLPSLGLISHTLWGGAVGGAYAVLNDTTLIDSEFEGDGVGWANVG